MSRYFIHEANLERLQKKLTTIRNKCIKNNLDFHFEVVGEEYREHKNAKNEVVNVRYIEVEAFGSISHENWEFVGVVDHHTEGNIIRQMNTDVAVPIQYRHTTPICEHCNKIRSRKQTYVIHNSETNEWKQVGTTCLCEFTNGLDAEEVASYISMFDQIIKGEAISGSGHIESYYPVEDIIRYAWETVKHFGYVKRDYYNYNPDVVPTVDRAMDYYLIDINRFYGNSSRREQREDEMNHVKFNAHSDEANNFVDNAIQWILSQDADANNSYISNLQILCKEGWCKYNELGIVMSIVPSYQREMQKAIERAERAAAHASEQTSIFVGEIGKRITVDNIKSAECVYTSENIYGLTFMYKIVDTNNNVYMWSTSNTFDTDRVAEITGTVKNHEEYKGVKQTWLTRCKVTNKPEEVTENVEDALDEFYKSINA